MRQIIIKNALNSHLVSLQCTSLHSFHGAAVNVTAKPFMPYWGEAKERAPDGSRTTVYRGSDYRLLDAVSLVLNFTVRILETPSWAEVSCEKIELCFHI